MITHLHTPEAPLDTALLYALAPQRLASRRNERYSADDLSVPLDSFGEAEQQTFRELYAWAGALLASLRQHSDSPVAQLDALRQFLQRSPNRALIAAVQAISLDARAHDDEASRMVLHDLKGGCLTGLVIGLQLVQLGVSETEVIQRVFFAARDYLKIMRSSLRGLDPAGYQRDREARLHSARLIAEKWSAASYSLPDRTVRVETDCRFHGDISERCLEFAAVDRMLYNLLHNAAKNAADERVYLTLLPLPGDEDPRDVRFVVYNRVRAQQRQALEERFGGRLGDLFLGGFTTDGNGLGLRICAELVTNAYGLGSVEECLEVGYVGAGLRDGCFVNWVHWPVAGG